MKVVLKVGLDAARDFFLSPIPTQSQLQAEAKTDSSDVQSGSGDCNAERVEDGNANTFNLGGEALAKVNCNGDMTEGNEDSFEKDSKDLKDTEAKGGAEGGQEEEQGIQGEEKLAEEINIEIGETELEYVVFCGFTQAEVGCLQELLEAL